ncbi:hypothetical protein ACFWH4_32375 [Streptomyces sp. NPDC127091]|uniref:hypothetical protein n=1 Tax=Streptomyces sp. NPDC127091 TaxID=3347134 RepID=UPI0036658F16
MLDRMDAVGPHVHASGEAGAWFWEAVWSSCHCSVSRVTVAAESSAAEPGNCSMAGAKPPEDRPGR